MSSPPLPLPLLADVLGRLAVALAAGVDVRKAVASEAARLPRRWRPVLEAAAVAVGEGEPLAAALGRTAGAVPADVLGMVAVGDRTGRDAETLRDVAAALGEAVAARRSLVAAVVPAALRLAVALGVIGLLILISLDMLGLGLTGLRGLVIYCLILSGLALTAALAIPRLFRSWQAHGVVRRLLSRLPLLGPAARAGEAARWCRAASLAAGAGLDAGGLVTLASQAAPGLTLDPHDIEERLRLGDTLAEALAASGRLPAEVIDAVGLGELSGTVAESLGRLVPEQLAAARRGYAAAVGVVGAAAWVAVAGLVVLLVFRVLGVYVGILEEAGRPL